MATISSGVARPAVSSITETRYCISDHLPWFGAPLVGGRSYLLRTTPPRSDTASRISFEDFLVRRLSAIRQRDGFGAARPRSQTVLTSPEHPSADLESVLGKPS